MSRRSKINPLYYDLRGLRNKRFEHRSLKRYKKKFPRERLISKWFPWADIHIIGMDLYEGDRTKEGLVSRMEEHYEINVLLRRQWKFEKTEYPQTADLDTVGIEWAVAFFSKFLTWKTQALHGFACSEERFKEIKEYLRKEHRWQFGRGFAPEVEALIFSPFDQVYNEFQAVNEESIVVGLAPTGGLEHQLTPQMMLHELTEFIIYNAIREGEYDREDCLLGFGRILPKFKNKRLYRDMLTMYINRRETGNLLLELYWKNGRLFTPDDFLTYNEALPIYEDRLNALEEELKVPSPAGASIGDRMMRRSLLRKKYGIPSKWHWGIESPTEVEKIEMVDRINEFCGEYTEKLLAIDKPIFMRL